MFFSGGLVETCTSGQLPPEQHELIRRITKDSILGVVAALHDAVINDGVCGFSIRSFAEMRQGRWSNRIYLVIDPTGVDPLAPTRMIRELQGYDHYEILIYRLQETTPEHTTLSPILATIVCENPSEHLFDIEPKVRPLARRR